MNPCPKWGTHINHDAAVAAAEQYGTNAIGEALKNALRRGRGAVESISVRSVEQWR